MRRPNFILTILGMLILAVGISILSILYWLVSNLIVIVAGIGTFFIFLFFLGSIYSYFKDARIIQENFDGERANELILSLKKRLLHQLENFLY